MGGKVDVIFFQLVQESTRGWNSGESWTRSPPYYSTCSWRVEVSVVKVCSLICSWAICCVLVVLQSCICWYLKRQYYLCRDQMMLAAGPSNLQQLLFYVFWFLLAFRCVRGITIVSSWCTELFITTERPTVPLVTLSENTVVTPALSLIAFPSFQIPLTWVLWNWLVVFESFSH